MRSSETPGDAAASIDGVPLGNPRWPTTTRSLGPGEDMAFGNGGDTVARPRRASLRRSALNDRYPGLLAAHPKGPFVRA